MVEVFAKGSRAQSIAADTSGNGGQANVLIWLSQRNGLLAR